MTRIADAGRNIVPLTLAAVALTIVPLAQGGGGGDSPRNVLTVGVAAAASAVASLLYTRLEHDQKRAARVRLAAWACIRFFLAFELMRYGVAKIVGMQFYRRYYLLDTRVIDLQPSNLAWSFFGGSYAYQAISGVLEIGGALLVCFRRTTTLGACLLFAVMSNVVVVNFYYGVSVKLLSSTFLVMIIYLLANEGRRFWAFFFSDGPVPPREYLAAPAAPRAKWSIAANGLLVAIVLGVPTWDVLGEAFKHHLFTAEPILGAWNVDRRSGLEDLLPAASTPWEKVYFEKGDYGFIRIGGKQRVRFDMKVDPQAHTLQLSIYVGQQTREVESTFDLGEDKLHIEGSDHGKPFALDLTRAFPP